jgi:hypothetical protein
MTGNESIRFAMVSGLALTLWSALLGAGLSVKGATMTDQEIRAALARHWSMTGPHDPVAYEIYHDDLLLEFPQSGERFRGLANVRAFRQAYPAKVTFDIKRHLGAGEVWVTELVVTYDGKKSINAVSIMEFREGKVARETLYFGDPFEAPAWRSRWVERME